jgi:hypothetical protein
MIIICEIGMVDWTVMVGGVGGRTDAKTIEICLIVRQLRNHADYFVLTKNESNVTNCHPVPNIWLKVGGRTISMHSKSFEMLCLCVCVCLSPYAKRPDIVFFRVFCVLGCNQN